MVGHLINFLLLPLVYDELRKLAAQRLARESPGQTLQGTALVHEAYLRLVGSQTPSWTGRGHFFAAAADRYWAYARVWLYSELSEDRLRPSKGTVTSILGDGVERYEDS
jgi:hypothetical protein